MLFRSKDGKTLFHEDVKRMIAIRRENPDLFAYWPLNHRDTNIVEVKAGESVDYLLNE